MSRLALPLLLLSALAASSARADAPRPTLVPPLRLGATSTTAAVLYQAPSIAPIAGAFDGAYYGYQTILVRVAGGGLLAVGIALADSDAGFGATIVGGLGVLTMTFGPLAVHFAHDETGNALLSLLGNVVLTATGLTIGIVVPEGGGEFGGLAKLAGGFIGVCIAQVVMLVVDATVLGFETTAHHDIAVMPALLYAPDGAPLGGLAVAF